MKPKTIPIGTSIHHSYLNNNAGQSSYKNGLIGKRYKTDIEQLEREVQHQKDIISRSKNDTESFTFEVVKSAIKDLRSSYEDSLE